jgi:hypothetical protein
VAAVVVNAERVTALRWCGRRDGRGGAELGGVRLAVWVVELMWPQQRAVTSQPARQTAARDRGAGHGVLQGRTVGRGVECDTLGF